MERDEEFEAWLCDVVSSGRNIFASEEVKGCKRGADEEPDVLAKRIRGSDWKDEDILAEFDVFGSLITSSMEGYRENQAEYPKLVEDASDFSGHFNHQSEQGTVILGVRLFGPEESSISSSVDFSTDGYGEYPESYEDISSSSGHSDQPSEQENGAGIFGSETSSNTSFEDLSTDGELMYPEVDEYLSIFSGHQLQPETGGGLFGSETSSSATSSVITTDGDLSRCLGHTEDPPVTETVMNKFLGNVGVSDEWSMIDVIDLDDEHLENLPKKIKAVLFLFPKGEQHEEHCQSEKEAIETDGQVLSDRVYFMKLDSNNASGTVSIIHAVANADDELELAEGSSLKEFLERTKDMSPEERGQELEMDETLCCVHEIVAKEGQTEAPQPDEEVKLHFITFVAVDEQLYELDAHKNFPVNHGSTSMDTLLKDAVAACKKFMERDPENVNFSIMALVGGASADTEEEEVED